MVEVLLIVCFFFLLLASFFDVKTREIPDFLTYGVTIFALFYRFVLSFFLGWNFLFEGLIGLFVSFLIACLLFYSGQWGGGDAKSLMTVGILFGFQKSWNSTLSSFLVNLVFAGAVYSIFFIIILALKNKKKVFKTFKKHVCNQWKELLIVSVLLFLSALLLNISFDLKFFFITGITVSWTIYFFTLLVHSVEKTCMITLVSPSKLTEGDWVVKDVIYKGRIICSRKSLGLNKEQINQLKKLKKKVWIKRGIPFLPSFLLSFILTIWQGNLLNFILLF